MMGEFELATRVTCVSLIELSITPLELEFNGFDNKMSVGCNKFQSISCYAVSGALLYKYGSSLQCYHLMGKIT